MIGSRILDSYVQIVIVNFHVNWYNAPVVQLVGDSTLRTWTVSVRIRPGVPKFLIWCLIGVTFEIECPHNVTKPLWRNGRRAALKMQYPEGCKGSNPFGGTKFDSKWASNRDNPLNFNKLLAKPINSFSGCAVRNESNQFRHGCSQQPLYTKPSIVQKRSGSTPEQVA